MIAGRPTRIFASALALTAGCTNLNSSEEGLDPSVVVPALEQGQFRQTASPLTAQECASLNLLADGPSLILHDPTLLTPAFPLTTTLQTIINSNPTGSGGSTPASFMQSILDSFNVPSQTNIAAGLDMEVDVRPGEAGMNASALVSAMVPVALFNRFDLTPSNGAHCGEYRIIYGLPAGAPGLPSGRFFLIFEAAMPNPNPALGREGCRPVAEFWAHLSDVGVTDSQRIARLVDFYYNGTIQDGVPLPAAVDFAHYQGAAGQIRSNHFINFFQWQLREFRTASIGGQAVAVVDTTKDVPLTEMFDQAAPPSPFSDPVVFDALRTDFRNEFVNNQLTFLAAPELAGATDPVDIINGFAFGLSDRFFEFQSNSQGLADSPAAQADANLRAQIDANLPDPSLDATLLLNRAGTQTCGGCHQFSANQPIAAGPDGAPGTADDIRWPGTLGFVHVDEVGNISPALTDAFLPARKRILEDFVCSEPTPAIELGQAQISATSGGGGWTLVQFATPFSEAPAVFITANQSGSHPCTTRIRNVTSTGFEVACLEPLPLDGPHAAMTVAYAAATRGAHTLGNQVVEVDCADVSSLQHNTSTTLTRSWQQIAFSTPFANAPMVLAQIQSDNSGALPAAPSQALDTWMTAAIREVKRTTFQAALDLAEVSPAGTIRPEEVCWLATEQGVFSFADAAGTVVRCESAAPSNFTGWDDGCIAHAFGANFAQAPLSVGHMMTRKGNNGGWARQCSLNATSVGYRIDEDQFNDTERSHIAETVGILSCSAAFHAE